MKHCERNAGCHADSCVHFCVDRISFAFVPYFARRRKAGKSKPTKPLKSHKKGTKRYDLHSLVQKTLGSGDMRQAVKLPPGERFEEWLAVHVADFFNEVTLIYTIIEDEVTPEKVSSMLMSISRNSINPLRLALASSSRLSNIAVPSNDGKIRKI